MYVLIAGITTEEHWCHYGIFCRLSHQKGLVCGAFPWRHVGETRGVKTLSPLVEGVSCDFGRGHLFEFSNARRMHTGSNRLATNSSWHRRGSVTCVKPTWTMHTGGNDDMVWAFIPGPSRCSKYTLLKWSGISVVFFQKKRRWKPKCRWLATTILFVGIGILGSKKAPSSHQCCKLLSISDVQQHRNPMTSVCRAGPQPRSCDISVACRTSTTILWVQCGVPDLNRDPVSSVWRAGPQPRLCGFSVRAGPQLRSCESSVACRTSTAIMCVQCGVPDLNREDMSERMSEDASERMSEEMSERMSEDMSEGSSERMSEKGCQKECQKKCQKEVGRTRSSGGHKMYDVVCAVYGGHKMFDAGVRCSCF